jgi:hypothetical protein
VAPGAVWEIFENIMLMMMMMMMIIIIIIIVIRRRKTIIRRPCREATHERYRGRNLMT